MRIIKKRIKELGMTVESFCDDQGYRYTDFGSKQKTVQRKYDWLNKFFNPLGLEVIVRLKKDVNG